MIKVKLFDLKNRENAFREFMDIDFPIKVSFKLTKMFKEISRELSEFEEHKNKLIKKYGETKDDNIVVKEDELENFYKEYNELLEMEVELDTDKIELDINLLNDIKVNTRNLGLMELFIDFKE